MGGNYQKNVIYGNVCVIRFEKTIEQNCFREIRKVKPGNMIKIPNVITEQYEPVEEVDGRENVIRLLKRENGRYYILKVYDAGSLEVLLSLKKLSPRGVPTIREIYREAFGSAALQNSESSDTTTTQNVEPSATNASKNMDASDDNMPLQKTIYVIEDEISGTRLDRFIKQNKNTISAEWIYRFIDRATSILERLHRASPPLIHRDIKPENIMIGALPDCRFQEKAGIGNPVRRVSGQPAACGEVWLLDFNISRLYDNKAAHDRTDRDTHIMGTFGFAAPEQYGFMESDARSDVYGLGATVEFILDKTGVEDRTLRKIVKKCKEFSPKDRYQSMAELRRVVSKFVPDRERRKPDYSVKGRALSSAGIPGAEIIIDSGIPGAEISGTGSGGFAPSDPEKRFASGEMSRYSDGNHSDVWPPNGLFTGRLDRGLYKGKYHRYAPPGFRRGSPGRMLFAIFWYYALTYSVLHYTIDESRIAAKYYHTDLVLNRILISITMVAGILFTCNYLDIWDIYPTLRENPRWKRMLFVLIGDIVLFVSLVCIVYMIESLFMSS